MVGHYKIWWLRLEIVSYWLTNTEAKQSTTQKAKA